MTKTSSIAGVALWLICAGCGDDSGAGGDQMVERLRGEAAARAAVRSALSLSSAFAVILSETPAGSLSETPPGSGATADVDGVAGVVSGGGEMRAAPDSALRLLVTANRAMRVPCPLGGSVDGECREGRGQTTITSRSAECALVDAQTGLLVISNGGLEATVEATGVCGSGVPPGATVTTEMRDFSATVRDGDDVVEQFASARSRRRYEPALGGGCGGADGRHTLAGDLSSRRSDGTDVSMVARDLGLDVSSSGNPCRRRALVGGGLTVGDRARGGEVGFEFAALEVTLESGFGERPRFGFDGVADIGCLGEVSFTGGESLVPVVGVCPGQGEMAIELAEGLRVAVLFGGDSVAFDFDADGVVDSVAVDCVADLAACGE